MEDQTSLERVAAEVAAEARKLPGVQGVLLIGSAATGEVTSNSDYDFMVMIDDAVPWPLPFRDGGRRAWIDASGRQVEAVFTTIGRFRRACTDEEAAGSCLRRSGCARSRILWAGDDTIAALIAESQAIVDADPAPMDSQDVLWECYDLWNQLKDIQDELDDPYVVQVMSAPTFGQLVRFFFRLSRRWSPRLRNALATVDAVDRDFHALCVHFLDAQSAHARYETLKQMADYLSRRFGLTFEAGYTSSR